MRLTRVVFAFITILLIATALRLYALDEVPPGFFCDEPSAAYNAYSFLRTGYDEFGNRYPLMFPAFGDFKYPVHIYPIVLSIATFGLNEFSARLPSAIFGILGVVAAYFLGKELYDARIGLLSALLLAISPWHIQFSRWAVQEAHFVFFLTAGAFFLFAGVKRDARFLVAAALMFALCFYTYGIAYLFIPMFIAGFVFLYWRELSAKWRWSLMAIIGFLLFLSPMLFYSLEQPGGISARFNQVSALKSNATILENAKVIADNYKGYYSLDFLFIKGDENYRHSSKGAGELYCFEFPLILIGLGICLWKRTQTNWFLLYWLAIFPLAASFTAGPPSAIRSVSGLPLFQILAASAVSFFYSKLAGKTSKTRDLALIGLVLLAFIAFTQVYGYVTEYYSAYPIYSAYGYYGFEYGNKEIYEFTEPIKDNYEWIGVTGRIHQGYIFPLFYTAYDPAAYHAFNEQRGYYRPHIIGKYHMDLDLSKDYEPGKHLYVLKPEELNSSYGYEVKHTIYSPSGQALYKIVEITYWRAPSAG